MDILLDEFTNDIIYINGQIPVTPNELTTVSQRLKVRLQTFLGEYFINTTSGVPYYQRIFGKVRSKATIDTIFQQQILSDAGVIEITSYESTLDNASRFLDVTFTVRTSEGVTNPITITIGA
jgi:hypothetical protein